MAASVNQAGNKAGRKKLWISILIAAAVLLVAGILFFTLGNQNNKAKVIRVGSTAPGHFKYILNEQHGFWKDEFEKDGITVEFYPFSNGGSEALTALANGNVDITYTGADPAMRTAAAGADVALIGLSSYDPNSGSSSIIVRADSDIQSVKDLKGKKVAVLTGTMRHSTLSKALTKEGLSLSDVETLSLPFESSGPALVKGDIDAVVESTTTFTSLLETGSVRMILDGSEHPEWSVPSAISVNGKFARENPELLERFLKVDLEISKWADENFDEAVSIFAEGTQKKPETIEKDYPDGKFFQDPTITEQALNAFKDEEKFLIDAGLSNGSLDYDKWVQSSYLDNASKR